MKKTILILAVSLLLLAGSALCADNGPLRVHYVYLASTEAAARDGARTMAGITLKRGKILSQQEKEFVGDDGKHFWASRLIIEVTSDQLMDEMEELETLIGPV
jgi:hypothetical protein